MKNFLIIFLVMASIPGLLIGQDSLSVNSKYINFEFDRGPMISAGYFLQQGLALEAGIALAFDGEINSNGDSQGGGTVTIGEPLPRAQTDEIPRGSVGEHTDKICRVCAEDAFQDNRVAGRFVIVPVRRPDQNRVHPRWKNRRGGQVGPLYVPVTVGGTVVYICRVPRRAVVARNKDFIHVGVIGSPPCEEIILS